MPIIPIAAATASIASTGAGILTYLSQKKSQEKLLAKQEEVQAEQKQKQLSERKKQIDKLRSQIFMPSMTTGRRSLLSGQETGIKRQVLG